MQVDGPGMDRGEGPLGLDRAEELAGARARRSPPNRPRRSAARCRRRETAGRAAGSVPRGPGEARRSPPRRRRARASARRTRRRPPPRAASRRPPRAGARAGSARSRGPGSPPPPGARGTPPGGGRRTGRARPGRPRRAAMPSLRRARPAPHLAQARDGAREGDADRRVELADVDAQLERVGGDHREQLARRQARLDLPSLLRACSRPGRERSAGARSPWPSSSRRIRANRWISSMPRRLRRKQIVRTPSLTRSASSSAASERTERRVIDLCVDHRRVPHRRSGARRAERRRSRSAGRARRPAARRARAGWRSSPRRGGSAGSAP